MAFALKYYHNFKQIKEYTSDDWRIEIYLDGYGGASSELAYLEAGSVNLSRQGDVLTQVWGSKLSFGLYNQTEAQYKEFRTASYGDYKVVLIKDPSGTPETKFIGYNQSEIYTETYNTPPYTTTLEFTCGLSHLKHIRWDNSGTLYTGQKSIIETIRLCLNQLPEPIKIREFVNIYEDSINSTTTDSMLNQIYITSETYKEKDKEGGENEEKAFFCHKVLEEILKPFNAHIYHANGIWYIIRTQEYLDTTMYYREFNPNVGTESTITVDATGNFTSNKRTVTGVDGTSTELILQSETAELSIQPPINRAVVEYNMVNFEQENSNIIKNGAFVILSSAGANPSFTTPSYWTVNGDDPSLYQAIDGFINPYFRFEPTAQGTATAFDATYNITQSKLAVPTATVDSLEFSFQYLFDFKCVLKNGGTPSQSVSNFINNDLFVAWEVEMKFGTYYLSGDTVSGFSWTTTPSRATFKKTGFQIGAATYVLNYQGVHEIAEALPTLPQNNVVTFDFTIYRAYTNISTFMATVSSDYTYTFGNIWFRNIDVVYLPDELPPIDEIFIYSFIDEDEEIEEITCIHGDGTNSVTLNSFRLASKAITDAWTRRGIAESEEVLVILLRQLRDLRGDFTRLLSGNLIGEIDVFNTIEDTTDVTTHFMIASYDWSIEASEYRVELIELITSLKTLVDTKSITPRGTSTTPSDTDTSTGAASPAERIVSQGTILSLNQNNLSNYN